MATDDEQAVATSSSTNKWELSHSHQDDRVELLNRARAFLVSPQVRHEDVWAKRTFLAEKGLTDSEVDGLIRELPPQLQVSQVPPRTYPQPPPSKLPDLLAGILRIISWVVGGSAALLLVYYRFILPRLTQSLEARYALRGHQKDLLLKFGHSLEKLKTIQGDSFSELPRPDPYKEHPLYESCQTVDDILRICNDRYGEIPELSLLRCVLGEFAAEERQPSTQDLFEALREKIPWLSTDEGLPYQEKLWQTLITAPVFVASNTTAPDVSTWSYAPPTRPSPSPLLASLTALKTALPLPRKAPRYEHTQQALTDFTGYLTTRAYASSAFLRGSGPGVGATGGLEEEEVKREIRALKGLVLNRRSFMGSIPGPRASPSADVPTP